MLTELTSHRSALISNDTKMLQLRSLARIIFIMLVISAVTSCNKTALHGSNSKRSADNTYKVWNQYGGAADQSKYVDFKQITKENVSKLELAWTYSTNDNVATYKFNPIVVDNMMS